MSESATLSMRFVGGGLSVLAEKSYSADAVTVQSYEVADSATDEQRTLGIDVSEMQAVFIVSDQDILMEWNDNAGAQGSIAMKANVPFIERLAADQYHVALMDVDVTDLYWTNASGFAANISIGVVKNNTP